MIYRLVSALFLVIWLNNLTGCVSNSDIADQTAVEASPEKGEDAHGWGANIQNPGK